MRHTWLNLTAVTAMAGGLFLAAAQEVPSQPAQPAAPQHQRWHNQRARIAEYLHLTPAQRAGAKAQFQAVRQSAQPIRQQLRQVRQAIFQAIRANDTAKIDQLSAQEANLRGQISAMRLEAAAKIYSNLTPEQRAKADQLPARFRQMMRQRRMGHTPDNS